jgi:predicted CDP-diglyceride synthetase/phosphatidate cytidylyltransferase
MKWLNCRPTLHIGHDGVLARFDLIIYSYPVIRHYIIFKLFSALLNEYIFAINTLHLN